MWWYLCVDTHGHTACYRCPQLADMSRVAGKLGAQFRSSLRELNLMAIMTITIGFNEGSWFSYMDATRIITGIDSLILVKFAALQVQEMAESIKLWFRECLHFGGTGLDEIVDFLKNVLDMIFQLTYDVCIIRCPCLAVKKWIEMWCRNVKCNLLLLYLVARSNAGCVVSHISELNQ